MNKILFILAIFCIIGLLGMLICTIAFALFDRDWNKAFTLFGCQAIGCVVLGMIVLLLSEMMAA